MNAAATLVGAAGRACPGHANPEPTTANAPHQARLVCPTHRGTLRLVEGANRLECLEGCAFQIVENVPRFVPLNNYADSFGLQWNVFRTTQLDSVCGLPISRERLRRIAGGSLEWLKGKQVLEAGCGAGRFTEVLLDSGATVTACDLSRAVDANHFNCGANPGHSVVQADIQNLPFGDACFDVVICIGVLQHTPSPERSIEALVRHIKPGGVLMIDHYALNYPETVSLRTLRRLLLRLDTPARLRIVDGLVNVLWPVHRFVCWASHGGAPSRNLLQRGTSFLLSKVSPIVDHQYRYPGLSAKQQKEWAFLDTHDTLTDVFKHKRSPEQLAAFVRTLGLVDIECWLGGNGVELRATFPRLQSTPLAEDAVRS